MRKSPQALTLRFKRIIALAVKRFSDTVCVFLVPFGRLGKLLVGGGRRNIGACLIAPREINVLSDDLRSCCRTLATASQHPVASAGGWGGKTGLYFIDLNSNPQLTEKARCLIARYDSGISNHKGVNSGVFIEGDDPKAISFYDKDGNYRVGRIRKLMPCESWMLQGFSREQFDKAAALGTSDGHLYRLAGNAVSVPVIKAIGKKIGDAIFSEGDDKIA